jgi:hypothetical protein
MSLADFTKNLAFPFTIVPHEIVNRSIVGTMFRNIAFNTAENRFDSLMVALVIIADKILKVPFLFERDNFGKLVNLKFLILRRMGIIKSPLFERNIFTLES